MKTRLRNGMTRVDIAALLVFAALWIYYIVIIRYGFALQDESGYLSFADHFLHDGRPLVDDWHVGQLSYFYLCPILKAYAAVRGSLTGVILFMRWVFLAFNAAVYWIMYAMLRKYGWRALIATALFVSSVPLAIYACNYYNIPQRLLMLVFLILFSEKQKPLPLLLAGVLFACAVLEQPGLTLLYLGYSVLVFVRFFRQKKGKRFLDDYAFCVNTRTWGLCTASIVLCAAVFLSCLLARSGLHNILSSVPYILGTDPEYDYSAGGAAWGVLFRKLADVTQIYSVVCLIPAALVLLLSIAYACGAFRDRRERARKWLFCLACAVWIVCCVTPLRIEVRVLPDSYKAMFQVPFVWFGLVCYLLCEKRNKRFFFFWIAGLLSSLCIDIVSEVMLAICSPIAYIAAVMFTTDLIRELRAERGAKPQNEAVFSRNPKKAKRLGALARLSSRAACVWFAVWFVFVLVYLENPARMAHEITDAPLFGLTYRCEKGPYRGLFCGETFGKNYDDRLADIDTLRQKQPKNLYIYGLAIELYLYADLPYATCSPYSWGDETYLNRHVQFWQLHPEHLPACIYVSDDPYYNKLGEEAEAVSRIRQIFDPLCDYTMETGKSGYILYVSRWRLPEPASK